MFLTTFHLPTASLYLIHLSIFFFIFFRWNFLLYILLKLTADRNFTPNRWRTIARKNCKSFERNRIMPLHQCGTVFGRYIKQVFCFFQKKILLFWRCLNFWTSLIHSCFLCRQLLNLLEKVIEDKAKSFWPHHL